MPRRRRPEPREVVPDPLYNSTLVEKFVNSMMWDGKKNTSQRILPSYGSAARALGRRPFEGVQKSRGECQAAARSEDPPRGWRQLPGPGRGSAEPPGESRAPLDYYKCPRPSGQRNGREAGQ